MINHHNVKSEILEPIFRISNAAGVCFYHAVDDRFQPRLVVSGVTYFGEALKTDQMAVESQLYDLPTVVRWISNHKGRLRGHIFAMDTFRRMLYERGCKMVRATSLLDEQVKFSLYLTDADDKGIQIVETGCIDNPIPF